MQETNLGLKKPELNEFYDLLLNNDNLDLLDQLIADRIQKSMIVNNTLSTNPDTVVAGPVAKDLQEQINSLNDNLASSSFINPVNLTTVKYNGTVTSVASLDNCKTTGAYHVNLAGEYSTVLVFAFAAGSALQIRVYDLVAKVDIRQYYDGTWSTWKTIIP